MKKRIASLLLALTFVLAMSSIPAMASGSYGGAGNDGAAIKIDSSNGFSVVDATFTAYKIFDLVTDTYNATADTHYAYTLAAAFAGSAEGVTPVVPSINDYQPVKDITGGVSLWQYLTTLSEDSTLPYPDPSHITPPATDPNAGITTAMDKLADAIWSYISTYNIAYSGTATGHTGDTIVTIPGLDYGYYLVYSKYTTDSKDPSVPGTLVASSSLTTVFPCMTVVPKVDAPTLDKTVYNHNTEKQENWTDVNIGDKVDFTLTSMVPNTKGYSTYVYTVHDVMSSGLTFDPASVKVSIGGTVITSGYTLNVAPSAAITDTCTFEIVFDNKLFINDDTATPALTSAYNAGDQILVTYYATLNSGAEVSTDPYNAKGNPNDAWLEYSNNPNANGDGTTDTGTTPKSDVEVYTFQVQLTKIDGKTAEDTVKKLLAGAEFTLTNEAGDLVKFVETLAADDNSPNVYRVATADDTTTTTTIKTPVSGELVMKGLDAGTYTLTETKAPAGYNKLDAPKTLDIVFYPDVKKFTAVIAPDTAPATSADITTSNLSYNVFIANNAGVIFPGTGGMGTTVFVIGGVLLMLAAAVALIVRRRMSNLEK